MIDLGKHAAFIWSSYAIVAVVLTVLIGWLVTDGLRLKRRISELEAQGMTRRSETSDD